MSAEAERYVLGAMMLDARCIDEIALTPPEHYEPRHEAIHHAILAVHATGARPDPLTVATELTRTGDLKRIGADYLHTLTAEVPTATNAGYYAEIVREAAARRAVIATGTRIVQAAGTATDTAATEIVATARGELEAVAQRIAAPDSTDTLTAILDAIEAIEAGPGEAVPSPWVDLDRLTGGWRPGAVYVIAGRPGTGKSVIGAQASVHAALHGHPALVVSCEMTRREVVNRWLGALGGVDLSPARLADRKLTEGEWDKVSAAQAKLADCALSIDDRSTVSVADIRARARDAMRRHGSLGLVVVDYLQLLTPARLGRDASRQEQVADMSRSLKVMAGDLQVPVLLLAQLNRGPESRTDRRPRVSDLRESGSVEQDADVVLLLHRDEEKAPDDLEMGVGKNRGGPTGSAELRWEGHYSRVVAKVWRPSDAARAS